TTNGVNCLGIKLGDAAEATGIRQFSPADAVPCAFLRKAWMATSMSRRKRLADNARGVQGIGQRADPWLVVFVADQQRHALLGQRRKRPQYRREQHRIMGFPLGSLRARRGSRVLCQHEMVAIRYRRATK